jgi:ATP-dependent RNA helicase DeaD
MQLKPELVNAILSVGFAAPTEVQDQAIPVVLTGKDVIVRAKTGTGKTAAFIVPIIQNMPRTSGISALVIVPTRELALQVATFADQLGRHMHIRTTTVYGGASMNVQISALQRGVNIVVGTPGRLIDLIERGALRLDTVRFVVLDEADRMLDMGFIEDVDYILSKTSQNRQMMLFSATMPRAINDIARHHMREDVVTISVGSEEEPIVETISHSYTFAKGRMKLATLLAYIDQMSPKKCIIFSRTKHESELIHELLMKKGYDATLLHGGLTQARREHSLHSFKAGAKFLIATNIASRGLDIADVTDIVNFDAPDTPENYIHRVGRSARMGKEGRAFTILGFDERGLLNAIQHDTNIKMQELHLNPEKYNDFEMPMQSRRQFNRGDHIGRRSRSWNNQHGSEHGGYQGGGGRGFGKRRGWSGNRGYSSRQGQEY